MTFIFKFFKRAKRAIGMNGIPSKFVGHRSGCTFCGKSLGKKSYFNPFFDNNVNLCDRFVCSTMRKFTWTWRSAKNV